MHNTVVLGLRQGKRGRALCCVCGGYVYIGEHGAKGTAHGVQCIAQKVGRRG